MNIISVLNNRKSVRSYLRKDINAEILDKVISEAINSEPLYRDIDIQFKLIIDGHKFSKKIQGHAGYFGKVFDAPHYIAVISENKKGFLENLGYKVEKLMIKSHELGLGTCWMELLFDTEKINKILDIDENHKALIITPIGYEKSPLIKKIIKIENQKNTQRKSLNEIVTFDIWNNFRKPVISFELECLKIMEYAKLAPSWGNKQPWRFLIDGKKILVFSEKDKISERKQKLNYYRIDCGIIMLYIKLLFEEFGANVKWVLDDTTALGKYNIPDNYEYIGYITIAS